jgi:hypothetical protein
MVVMEPELFGNGTPGMLTVTVPAGTPSGSHGVVFIEAVPASSPGALAYGSWGIWPVIVDVP